VAKYAWQNGQSAGLHLKVDVQKVWRSKCHPLAQLPPNISHDRSWDLQKFKTVFLRVGWGWGWG